MKIAFDLDGTAWRYRTWFSELAHALKSRGHQVGIMTGHDDRIREADLNLWVARGFPPADFLYNNDVGGVSPHGKTHMAWKRELAQANGVDVLFDDYGTYGQMGMIIDCWVNMPNEDNR